MKPSSGGLVAAVDRICTLVDEAVQRLAFAALAVMIVAITAQIVFRVFFSALSWSEELARYLLVWTTFLGATLAYRRGMHIAVTVVVEMFPPPIRRTLQMIAVAVAVAFFGIVLVHAVRYMGTQRFQVSASLRIPMPAIYAVMPFSLAIMALHGIGRILRLATERTADEPREVRP